VVLVVLVFQPLQWVLRYRVFLGVRLYQKRQQVQVLQHLRLLQRDRSYLDLLGHRVVLLVLDLLRLRESLRRLLVQAHLLLLYLPMLLVVLVVLLVL